ncbi:MAG: tRNA epoxyqueuosine(34) reductase QueG [Acidobacteriales bacterium]|nr:tRNA epoxyqueuosine(34) reductase QueG [Terriglobales bacterium]
MAFDLESVVGFAARSAGFDAHGIVNLRDLNSPELDCFAEWIEAGYAGEMKYLEARSESGNLKRAAIRNALPWARSLIATALNYNSAEPLSTEVRHKTDRGWISRYAWSREDYHDVLLRKLRLVESALHRAYQDHVGAEQLQTRCYVDTGPFVERVYAKYAGLGWLGKNTCLINQELGSWLFLCVIVTSFDFAQSAPALPPPDRCGSCTRCLDACPTHAFVEAYKLDATRCISYLSIEKRGDIPEELRSQMGNHLFGCDICQDVCPWNRKAPLSSARDLETRAELVNPPLAQFGEMTRDNFQQLFRRSPVKRAKYSGLRRNAAVAMGNSGDRSFTPALERMTRDEDAVVAEHSRWALKRLSRQP